MSDTIVIFNFDSPEIHKPTESRFVVEEQEELPIHDRRFFLMDESSVGYLVTQ